MERLGVRTLELTQVAVGFISSSYAAPTTTRTALLALGEGRGDKETRQERDGCKLEAHHDCS
jgi:hypothetical protein